MTPLAFPSKASVSKHPQFRNISALSSQPKSIPSEYDSENTYRSERHLFGRWEKRSQPLHSSKVGFVNGCKFAWTAFSESGDEQQYCNEKQCNNDHDGVDVIVA